jgi:Uma2 family endonuclease
MPTEIIRKRFTVHDYHRMGETGILRPKERLELIDGEIIEMSAIGRWHWVRVNLASTVFFTRFGDRGMVSTQNSLRLSDWSEPQPDLVIFKWRPDFYATKMPTPQDVLLLMEVSDSSFPFDRDVKLQLYAIAGIQEVWIEDANSDALYVFRNPIGDTYSTTLRLQRGDSISPIAFPEIQLSTDDLFGMPVVE